MWITECHFSSNTNSSLRYCCEEKVITLHLQLKFPDFTFTPTASSTWSRTHRRPLHRCWWFSCHLTRQIGNESNVQRNFRRGRTKRKKKLSDINPTFGRSAATRNSLATLGLPIEREMLPTRHPAATAFGNRDWKVIMAGEFVRYSPSRAFRPPWTPPSITPGSGIHLQRSI